MLDLCAFYAAHGWGLDALDDIASADLARQLFLDHARAKYYENLRDVIAAGVAKGMGCDAR